MKNSDFVGNINIKEGIILLKYFKGTLTLDNLHFHENTGSSATCIKIDTNDSTGTDAPLTILQNSAFTINIGQF